MKPDEVKKTLEAAAKGDPKASEELLPLVYAELRALGQAMMVKVPPGNTLQPTALVHEAYLRLVGSSELSWETRGHFFGAAAKAMRRILIDQARRKATRKHGGDQERERISRARLVVEQPSENILALDDALERLKQDDPRAAEIVSYRYFAGLTARETAAVMNLSLSTIEREWRFARTHLFTQLKNPDKAP